LYRVHCPDGIIAETDNLQDAEIELLHHYYRSGKGFRFDEYRLEHPTNEPKE